MTKVKLETHILQSKVEREGSMMNMPNKAVCMFSVVVCGRLTCVCLFTHARPVFVHMMAPLNC